MLISLSKNSFKSMETIMTKRQMSYITISGEHYLQQLNSHFHIIRPLKLVGKCDEKHLLSGQPLSSTQMVRNMMQIEQSIKSNVGKTLEPSKDLLLPALMITK